MSPKQTASAFISYARADKKVAELLQRALEMRGINAWRDIVHLDRGKKTSEEIKKTIRESDVFVFLITPQSLKSSFIREIEIPAAIENKKVIYPIFYGVDPEELSRHHNWKNFNLSGISGDVYDNSNQDKPESFFKEAGKNLLKIALKHAILTRRKETGGYKPTVAVRTFEDKSFVSNVDLDIDLTSVFNHEKSGQEVITQDVIPALTDIKKSFNELRCDKELTVYIKSRLTAAVIFGWIFRRVTGFKLKIIVDENNIWTTNAKLTEPSVQKCKTCTDDGDEAIIILNLSGPNNIEKSVVNFAKKQKIYLGAITLFNLDAQAITTPQAALSISKEIAGEIKSLNVTHNFTIVHVFGMMPAPLAVLIGYHLNACGQVAFYYSNPDNSYTKSMLINT